MTTVPHVVLVANTGWSVVRHRREQILGLVERGWRVSAVATLSQNEASAVRRLGADVVHNFSVKPSIWGSFAAKAAGVRGITCTITGAGPLRTDRQGAIQ